MNTETQPSPEALNADEAQHQQREHDGGGERLCLHCMLHDAFRAWKAKVGPALPAGTAGYQIGQFVAEVADTIKDSSPEAYESFAEHHAQAQVVNAMLRNGDAVFVVVEPDADVTVVPDETLH